MTKISKNTQDMIDEAVEYALICQALHMANEVFAHGGLDKGSFVITYLNGMGSLERKVADAEGIYYDKD